MSFRECDVWDLSNWYSDVNLTVLEPTRRLLLLRALLLPKGLLSRRIVILWRRVVSAATAAIISSALWSSNSQVSAICTKRVRGS
jgi:hypothetical protein